MSAQDSTIPKVDVIAMPFNSGVAVGRNVALAAADLADITALKVLHADADGE